MYKVLIAADSAKFIDLCENYFRNSYSITAVSSGEKVLSQLAKGQFGCIVLDMLAPGIDALALCAQIRQRYITPVLFINGKNNEEDIVTALMDGGDDYLSDSWSAAELGARIYALIRRDIFNKSTLVVDKKNTNIAIAGTIISFSKKEFDLLMLFYGNPNKIFSASEIYNLLWEKESVSSNSVAVYVKRIRSKLRVATDYFGQIKNSYKQGYYFLPARDKSLPM